MATIKSLNEDFTPFQIVIDVDTIDKAKVYASIFGSPYSFVKEHNFYGLGASEASRIIDDEFSPEQWRIGFQVHLLDKAT